MRTTGHWISFWLTLVMMTALIIFVYRGRGRRVGKGNAWHVYGPTILAIVATCLIMADLWRHILQDTGVWPERIFEGMKQADIVVGYQSSPPGVAGVGVVDAYYAPKDGQLDATGVLTITNKSFTVEEFSITMCFDRPILGGHHNAGDESFIIWAVGTHDYSFGSLKHTADPSQRSDSNPRKDWLSDSKRKATLSDSSATTQVSVSWTPDPDAGWVSICVTAEGPTITSRTWVGLGFTVPFGIGSSQYIIDFSKNCNHENNERVACLSTIGAVFTIFFTYSGFVLLAISTMWNANITEKIKKFREKWREIRGMEK